jgi:hypothetical protein
MFIAANTNVPITIRKELHNNGPIGPTTFDLAKSITPPAGCTVTPPTTTSHNLATSATVTADEVWTVNCVPGTYTLNFMNTLSPTALHIVDPNASNNSANTPLTVTVDTDGDGLPDDVEVACGSNPNNGTSIPERVDGIYAGQNDDLDGLTDEPLPGGASGYDCDRDGYTGTSEGHVYSPSIQGDQDPCGSNNSPPTVPASPIGWPGDMMGGGVPDSSNRINILDLTSFMAPIRYFDTDVGSNPGDVRWDLVPGGGIFPNDINIEDLTNLIVLSPPMIGGVRAFDGPDCPFPP